MTEETTRERGVSRRALLRWGAAGGAGVALAATNGVTRPYLARKGWLSPDGAFAAASTALTGALYTEDFPISPLILHPFTDELPVPTALAPVPRSEYSAWDEPPGPGAGQQNSLRNQQHQIWPNQIGYPDPIVYKIDLLVRTHAFTTSKVMQINSLGQPSGSFDAAGRPVAAGQERTLPLNTIYGFNGTFPGPRINAEYGKPVLVRFDNQLHLNPLGLDRGDFGAPDWSFLTHLHNGHTAPESDGNPHYSMKFGPKAHGFAPKQWFDALYLNWPAGGDDREKQSFFWFHDHRMDHTGANVYKGMVGLYPIYDPKNGLDMGDEHQGLQLPGVRTDHSNGSFDVEYDIPLAFYDCRLDDGVTVHHDAHDNEYPSAGNPRTHPEWWGHTFFRHFPNHGFVGDIFTVNGTAYPVLRVKRRKYRLRFLDASIARIYEFHLMTSTNGPIPANDPSIGAIGDDLQGQWRIPDGQQCMKFTQIASDGGLLPFPMERDSFELWPAKRREFVVDFGHYMDGKSTDIGDKIYLTNVMHMGNGRMWDTSTRDNNLVANYKVPVMQIIIDGDADDHSKHPITDFPGGRMMRNVPPLPANWHDLYANRMIFEVQRGNGGGEIEWLINGHAFDPSSVEVSLDARHQAARQKKNSFNLWEIRNGGGGWVHPFHLHMEEHRTVMRNNQIVRQPDLGHPDDASREDLINLDPSESVVLYRGFRDFVGPYVAHCHNLAHEDHAMMFGWEVTP